MSSSDFVVPPRSWDEIGRLAIGLRQQFGLLDEPHFPINEFIEQVLDLQLGLVRFEVEDKATMMNAEGYTDPNGEFIILREDVYEKGLANDGRARFTAAHELGHLVLHTSMPLARAPIDVHVPKFRLSEPQANQFAAELLMPAHFFTVHDTPHIVMRRHGVSFEAAQLRIRYLAEKGRLAG